MSDPPGAPSPAEPAEPAEHRAAGLAGRLVSERYRILRPIAQGGTGAVYLGEHLLLRKRVAVKILLPEFASEPQLIGRFEREAIAGAHVKSPHVAGATDFGQEPDGSHFLVLEYVPGPTLADEIQHGPLEPRRAVGIARQLALALCAVHEKGIVHRDLKPGNVILSDEENGAAKLVDFGFAKLRVERISTIDADDPVVSSNRLLTQVGMVLGTVSYMPPEIARGMECLDSRADLYALGVTLYEMLAGVPPFSGGSEAELFRSILHAPPKPLAREENLNVPRPIEAVMMRLLEKKPEDRYQTAEEVLGALEAAAMKVWGPGVFGDEHRSSRPASTMSGMSRRGLARGMARALSGGKVVGVAKTLRLRRPLNRVFDDAARFLDAHTPRPVRTFLRDARRLFRDLRLSLAERHVLRRSKARRALVLITPVLLLLVAALVWASTRETKEEAPSIEAATSLPDVASNEAEAEAPKEIDGLDAAAWVTRLRRAAETKLYTPGADAFLAIAQLEPSQFRDSRVRPSALAVVVGIAFEENAQADAVFAALAHGLGEDGLEMLYEIVRSKGGTKAYRRAVGILEQPETAARASSGLRVAFEMRRATCDGKRALFERAAQEGDERVLTELKALKYAPCRRKGDPCCYRNDEALTGAISTLGERLER